jgi:hypothetical protein
MLKARADSAFTSILSPHSAGSLALPQVASATLLCDLPADDLALGLLSTWTDASGNAHHFTAVGATRPTVAVIDGYKAVDFNGTNNWMSGGDFADNLEKFAVFTATRLSAENFQNVLIMRADYTNSQQGWQFENGGDTDPEFIFADNANNYVDSYGPAGRNVILPCVQSFEKLSNSESKCFFNGVNSGDTYTNGTVTDFSAAVPVTIGASAVPSNFNSCAYHRILMYQITDTENWHTDRDALAAWAIDRYGVTP